MVFNSEIKLIMGTGMILNSEMVLNSETKLIIRTEFILNSETKLIMRTEMVLKSKNNMFSTSSEWIYTEQRNYYQYRYYKCLYVEQKIKCRYKERQNYLELIILMILNVTSELEPIILKVTSDLENQPSFTLLIMSSIFIFGNAKFSTCRYFYFGYNHRLRRWEAKISILNYWHLHLRL